MEAADFIGVASFALSGFLTGVRHRLDIFGVALLSFLTALGGGIARDVIVGRIPASMQSAHLYAVVLAAIGTAIVLKLHKKTELEQKLIFVASDAIGLAATTTRAHGANALDAFREPRSKPSSNRGVRLPHLRCGGLGGQLFKLRAQDSRQKGCRENIRESRKRNDGQAKSTHGDGITTAPPCNRRSRFRG